MVGIPKRKRSGGPKTEAGKLAASGNSIKTGAYSSVVTIPGESQEGFQSLYEEFLTSLAPQGAVEQSMVYDLAAITWKKIRLDGLEQSAQARVLSKPLTCFDLRREFSISDRYDWIVKDISMLTEEAVRESNEHLVFISRLGDYGISKDDFYALPQTHPSLFQLIKEMAFDTFDYIDEPNPSAEQLVRLNKIYEDGQSEPFVHFAMRHIQERAEEIKWAYAHLEEIQAAIKAVREKRLLDLMQEAGLMRARDELGRAFYRTLSELRKQQQWRLKMTAIDVTPEE